MSYMQVEKSSVLSYEDAVSILSESKQVAHTMDLGTLTVHHLTHKDREGVLVVNSAGDSGFMEF